MHEPGRAMTQKLLRTLAAQDQLIAELKGTLAAVKEAAELAKQVAASRLTILRLLAEAVGTDEEATTLAWAKDHLEKQRLIDLKWERRRREG